MRRRVLYASIVVIVVLTGSFLVIESGILNMASSSPTISTATTQDSIKLGDVTLCTSDCGYPATYMSLTIFVNATSAPLRVLNGSIDGFPVTSHIYTNNWTYPFAIQYKTTISNETMTFTKGTEYDVTFVATFADQRKATASATAIAS